MKRLFIILAMLFLTLSLFAAGQAEEEKVIEKKGDVSLWTAYPGVGAVYEDLAKEYMADNPGVNVKITIYASRAMEDKCNTAFPAGVGPDIVEQDIPAVRLLIKNGHFDRPPDRIWDFYQKSVREQFKLQKTREDFWGLPSHVGMAHLFWNVNWFKEAGLKKAPDTVDEMIEYSRKLAKYDAGGKLTKSGISLRLSGGGFGVAEKWWVLALAPYGGSPQYETGKDKYIAGFDTPAAQKAVKLYIDLLYKFKVDSYAVDHDTPAFAKGVAAMFHREGTVVPFMEENAPNLEYGIAPVIGDVYRGSVVAVETFEVNSKSKNKELAWDFVLFLSEPDSVREKFLKSGRLPVRKDIDYEPVYRLMPKYGELNVFPEGYGTFPYYENSAFMEIWAKAGAWLTDLYTRKDLVDNPEGIREACEDFNEEANEILNEAGQYKAK